MGGSSLMQARMVGLSCAGGGEALVWDWLSFWGLRPPQLENLLCPAELVRLLCIGSAHKLWAANVQDTCRPLMICFEDLLTLQGACFWCRPLICTRCSAAL